MDNNLISGEILSFIDLLERHKIEIPIIQRDYAQGRNEHEDIRLEFLNALKISIDGSRKIKLDFIYGEIVDDVFQPLDGQQRLTTLFLLHWYASAKKGGVPAETVQLLKRFTYETRLSSRHFCNNLIEKSIALDSHKDVSELIKDKHWFYLSWEQDPSINAMLNTLDDINRIFCDVSDLWERLAEQKLITFHYLNLQDLGLSDDLYIKMNARGKQLTQFENFKAKFQKRIEDEKWEEGYAITDKFEFKIDTSWTELFWSKFGTKMDEAHVKFLSAIIMCKISLKPNTASRHDDLQQLNYNKEGKKLLQFLDKDVYEYIYSCYENFAKIEENNVDLRISDSEIRLWSHSCKNTYLEEIASDSSYTKKALFFAQIEFIRRNNILDFDREAYLEWMRVIRNFVCHANVTIKSRSSREDLLRDPSSFVGMINLISTLAAGCSDIYQFLVDNTEKGTYRKAQMDEEVRKAKIIREKPNLRDAIWLFEDLSLFRGKIAFVFDCLNKMSTAENESEEDKMIRLYMVFEENFKDRIFKRENADIVNQFNRAMLTIDYNGEYKYYDYWPSEWNALPTKAQKRKFIVCLEELYYGIYNERADANIGEQVNSLLLSLLSKNYQNIIDDFMPPDDMPKWKVKMIKEPKWLNERPSDFFAFTRDNSKCYLLKSQRPQNADGSICVE